MEDNFSNETDYKLNNKYNKNLLSLLTQEIDKLPEVKLGKRQSKPLSDVAKKLDEAKELIQESRLVEALRKIEKSIFIMEKCLISSKDNQELALLLIGTLLVAGESSFILNNYVSAERYFKQAYDLALESFEKYNSPDFVHYSLLISKRLVRLPFDRGMDFGSLTEAKKALELAERLNPKSKTSVLNDDMSDILVEMGNIEFHENNVKESIECYRKALSLNKGLVVTNESFTFYCKIFDETYEFAKIEEIKGNYEPAADYYKLAIVAYTPVLLQGYGRSFLPYLLSCHLSRAKCFRELNKPAREAQAYEDGINLIKLLPERLKEGSKTVCYIAYLYMNAAACLFFMGEREKGFKYISEAHNYAKKILVSENITGCSYKCYETVNNVYEAYRLLMEHP